MELSEINEVPDLALPAEAFRTHLRLGTGFADSASTDAELRHYLRAAIAVIEARTGKALLARGFRLVLARWRWPDTQALPIAPVQAIDVLSMRGRDGDTIAVDPARWRLVQDRHRPTLQARSAVLPPIPQGGQVEIDFTAGFGEDWDAVPADLAQAVFLLAAQYYEARGGESSALPVSVAALLVRWSTLRITAGGHRG